MKWQGRRASTNVEDRRGISSKALMGGGIGTIILALVVMLMGGNPLEYIGSLTGPDTPYEETAEHRELAEFSMVVLAETEDVWAEIFSKELGANYRDPTLVIYSGYVESACGAANASVGPFYCPGDEKIYLDLDFFTELKEQFHAPGDFAMAYVIAHEVGHHVQHQLGIIDDVYSYRGRVSEAEFNKLLVKMELQADYFAGVWAHYADRARLLEEGDIEEALNAAMMIGDDRIQMDTWGYVVPDRFTHGTSEQRSSWFLRGFKSGTIEDGDTFNAPELND
ncbi:MAG: neutral zinc metallopeptidase [Bacillota bacterium]|jgi:predicted metalloprotease|nr:neutral zinc metallopeptidase [Bacillota bacterium]HPZ22300.1 neutral zinc metallopeptidase [Bacillota bacterium]HQD19928.1 neutral zinc metallopeptidase [Bacillota bacterium]